MLDIRHQAIAGLIPPGQNEAHIRQKWPAMIVKIPAVATIGRILTQTTILAPIAWLLMAPFFALKFFPVIMRRYTLTNRRLMINAGWSAKAIQEIPLADIDDIKVQSSANDEFYRTGTLEIISNGNVVMTLPGTEDAESFKHAIINARNAWVPGKSSTIPFIPASTK